MPIRTECGKESGSLQTAGLRLCRRRVDTRSAGDGSRPLWACGFCAEGKVRSRSYQTFTLTYTVGRFGLDDTGAIRVIFRAMGDTGTMQTIDPTADNYVSATSSNGATLSVDYSGAARVRGPLEVTHR